MDNEKKHAAFSAYYDYSYGGELIPWAKQHVQANDLISPSNYYFIIDSSFYSQALSNEINIAWTDTGTQPQEHAATVLSVATGKANNSRTRGINPGQQVVHTATNLSDANVLDKLNWIASMAEWANQFSTLNVSFNRKNNYTQAGNLFNNNLAWGRATRRATARLFVTQSAGNFDQDACLASFNYVHGSRAQPDDGIMVVGGIDRHGNRYPVTPNPSPFATEGRSNYGPCVEVWAPGSEITTSRIDGSVVSLTGTSYSAPIVAAVAARYGNSTTRPIEREKYIRSGMVYAGKNEGAATSNLPMYEVRYTEPSSHNIPKRLPVFSAYSQTNTVDLFRLYDEKFFDEMFWSANGYSGSIVLDLGGVRQISGVRVMIRSSADGGDLNFSVRGGTYMNITGPNQGYVPFPVIATKYANDQYDLVSYFIPVSGGHRYIQIDAQNSSSWVAFAEAEVYGN